MSERTQINGFTGEVEPAADLQIAPSPADQRSLSMNVKHLPLIDSAEQFIQGQINADGASEPSPVPNFPITFTQGGDALTVPDPVSGQQIEVTQAQVDAIQDVTTEGSTLGLPVPTPSDDSARPDTSQQA